MSSEPIDIVLQRAARGQSRTEGLGPYYLIISTGARRLVYPCSFESVEAALQHCVQTYRQLEARIEDDLRLVICFKLSSKFVP
jgi:hypothetical protein